MRILSQSERKLADYELSCRKKKLKFGIHNNDNHFNTRIDLFCEIESLFVDRSYFGANISDESFIKGICKLNKLRKLEYREKEAKPDVIVAIGENLSNLSHITLGGPFGEDVNDDHLCFLFSKLCNLESIRLLIPELTGKCFTNIGPKVTEIEWDIDYGTNIYESLTFGGNGVNFKSFTFVSEFLDQKSKTTVMRVINNEMPNIRRLSLEMNNFDFRLLRLQKIEELFLRLFAVENAHSYQSMKTVKKLTLCLFDREIGEEKAIAVISNFPNLQVLELRIEDSDIILTNQFIVELKSLYRLKELTLCHTCEKTEKRNTEFLLSTVSALKSVNKITIQLPYLFDKSECDLISSNLETTAIHNQNMLILFECNVRNHKDEDKLK
ncbi:hypothetical protein B4U80_13535 [Leptotrombidium deliense]|uniref:FBD domain-containing protein n=1 Tax=Leptotrombidium deliense TaxID=299467 RepID=A0A443S4Y8_9ACAR|nr:hypothetical protein B4U80_13535 [Leptotrombidium deliense]